MDELKNFEDFGEDEKSTLVLDSTDELKVAGFAKEAHSKGKPAWWIEEKVREEKPHLTWIIPKVLGVETTAVNKTKYIVSKALTSKETSSSIKKLLYGLLGFVMLLLAGTFTINSRNHLMNPLTRLSNNPWEYTTTDSRKPKKTSTSYKNQIKPKTSSLEVEDKPVKEKPAKDQPQKEQTLYEFIMDEVQ